jgi:hypothetical protein
MKHRLERSIRAYVLGAGVLVSFCTAHRQARAQSTPNVIPSSTTGQGLDTHLFRPAMDSKGLFSVNGSDVLGKREFSFGLVLDYGHDLLRTPFTHPLIEHSFQGTLQFNYGLAPSRPST